MAQHNIFGKWGEDVAAAYLQQQGYTILTRNWRHEHKEIDIIATCNDAIYFIEVKTRHGERWNAEDAVNAKKRSLMIRAMFAWKMQHPSLQPVFYGIIAVVKHPNQQELEIRFNPKAFFCVRQ